MLRFLFPTRERTNAPTAGAAELSRPQIIQPTGHQAGPGYLGSARRLIDNAADAAAQGDHRLALLLSARAIREIVRWRRRLRTMAEPAPRDGTTQ